MIIINRYIYKAIFLSRVYLAKLNQTIEQIKNILKEDTRGLTIQELADLTHVSRITCSIALAKIEGQGLIDVRAIGKYKLHYLNKSVLAIPRL